MLAAMSGSELPTRALARKAEEEALAATAAAAKKTAASGKDAAAKQADKMDIDSKPAEAVAGKSTPQASGGGGAKGKKKKKGKK